MVDTITEAIYKRFSNDQVLTNQLSTYNGEPAIFSAKLAPEDARYRYLVIRPPYSNTNEIIEDNKSKNGNEEQRDVIAWDKQDTTIKELEKTINRVREISHRKGDEFNFGDRSNVRVRATGPKEAPRQEEEGSGLLTTLKITTQEARS